MPNVKIRPLEAERVAQVKLRDRVDQIVTRAQSKHRGVVFVPAGEASAALEPKCRIRPLS